MANPLLYYIDKNGNSVFRNFCLFKNSGNRYKVVIPVKKAGEIIEYRIELAKQLKYFNCLIILFAYLLYIHLLHGFWGLIFCENIAIILIFGARIYYSRLYEKVLFDKFGEYTVGPFEPPVTSQKQTAFNKNFSSKIFVIFLAVTLFFSFSFILKGAIRSVVNKNEPNYASANIYSVIYNTLYPASPFIYEFSALKNYSEGNFKNAVSNYIKVFELSGRKFTDKDFTRFANLLYFIKKSDGSQNAIDIFNEYATKKNTTILQQSKLLWIKSMFSIASEIPDFIEFDYDNLLSSLDKKDVNRFYILSDKAYMMYLKNEYDEAIKIYNQLIPYATQNQEFSKELGRLYVERGFTKRRLNDKIGANSDFVDSKIEMHEIKKYEPKLTEPSFIPYRI